MTVVYNELRVQQLAQHGYDIDMSDARDVFVNGNYANTELSTEQAMDSACSEFEAMIVYDTADDTAWPVMLYTLRGEMTAWYDCENYHGFIK